MTSTLRSIGIACGIFWWVLAMPLRAVADDEYDQFAIAKNAFDAGEYQAAVHRFDVLLKSGLQNPTLVVEALKLSGISYLFIGNEAAAEVQFTELLTKVPEYSLDPLVYPIEVVDFFTQIKQKNQKRFAELAKAKALEEAARKKKEEDLRKAEFEKMKRNVYIERNVRTGSLLVAVMPFGAGQFQNNQKLKGWAFFSSELLLGASATVFFFLHTSLRTAAEQPFDNPSEKDRYVRLERGYRLANQISLITLGVVLTAGIVDSLLNYRQETVEWHGVDEKDVPKNLHPNPTKASVSLDILSSESCFGVGVTGSF